MARVNVYIPDALAARMEGRPIKISALVQAAIRAALDEMPPGLKPAAHYDPELVARYRLAHSVLPWGRR